MSNFEIGETVLVELGLLLNNKTIHRLVKVRIDMLSHDRSKAVVTMLPFDTEKYQPINAEIWNVGKSAVVETRHLFRSKSNYDNTDVEFRMGDFAVGILGGASVLGTVISIRKNSIIILTSEGQTFSMPNHVAMVISPANRA